MTNVLDYGLEVSEFELKSQNNVHFWTNTLGKGMNLLIPSSYGLNIITAVLQQRNGKKIKKKNNSKEK